jgi:hypothetical protein
VWGADISSDQEECELGKYFCHIGMITWEQDGSVDPIFAGMYGVADGIVVEDGVKVLEKHVAEGGFGAIVCP